jgi:hypothetical protein
MIQYVNEFSGRHNTGYDILINLNMVIDNILGKVLKYKKLIEKEA